LYKLFLLYEKLENLELERNKNMEENKIQITFTEELRQEWLKVYFKQHPRARKEPIQYCTHPSINTWCILPRISMNTLKKNWGDFTKFVIEKQGLSMKGISKCECTVVIHQPTKGRAEMITIHSSL
jgi:hypothetical protein